MHERHESEHPGTSPHTININDRLISNLRDLSHVMRSLYEGRGSQKHILIVLAEIGCPVTQRELTERLGIRPGSASEVIAKLEGAGYIRRSPNETDQRTSDIVLTEEGKTAAANAKQQRICRHEEMFSCLAEDEKHQLLSLLEKINANWEIRYRRDENNHKKCEPDRHRHHRHGHCENHYQEGA